MDAGLRALIEAIHSTPAQAVLFLSGGASQALGWLLSVPGASSTVLEAVVPYSRTSMAQLLGKEKGRKSRLSLFDDGRLLVFDDLVTLEIRMPARFTSQQTAEEMALLAFNRALKLSRPGSRVIGVGFTGSLASLHPKHGDHRFCLSTRTCDRLWVSNVILSKGLRSREEEDKISSHSLVKAIANACKVSATPHSGLNESETPYECETHFDEDQELQQLIDGKICMKVYHFSGNHTSNSETKVILSGSFNPLHDGHCKLLEVATSLVDDAFPCFEISAINADKPPLSVSEIKKRVRQFEKIGKTVIISNQPYFYKKAELFPGSAFVIGADTAARLINPKYYRGDYDQMIEILLGCKRSGCTFLVGGRNIDGAFKVLEDFDIPQELKDMFISIPEDRFRLDISSTEIRNSRASSFVPS